MAAPSLRDYLDLTIASARDEWLGILGREWPRGDRQVDFVAVETLLAFALGLRSAPDRRGRLTIPRGDPLLATISTLLKRSPRSLPNKVENLDGRRERSARDELQLYAELTTGARPFDDLYSTIIAGARLAGVGPDALPDFLGSEDGSLALVSSAGHRVDSDLVESTLAPTEEASDPLTERVAVGAVRVGQAQFARRVLVASDYRCAFCGLDPRRASLRAPRMLVASHVKPWKHSFPSERVDPQNGVAACPTHDAAFEGGLLRVHDGGRIARAAELERLVAEGGAWERLFGDETLLPRLLTTTGGLPKASYLDWHWSNARVTLDYR